MWIMNSYGILMPAALPRTQPDYSGTWDDRWTLQIRARDRKPLSAFRKWSLERGYAPSTITGTPDKDYEYRMYVTKESFGHYMMESVKAIDYTKFKPTTERRGAGGAFLHDLYTHIWYVVATHYESRVLRPKKTTK